MDAKKEKELMREIKKLRLQNSQQKAKISSLKSELSKKNAKSVIMTEAKRKLLEEELQDTNIVNLLCNLLSG